MKKRMKFLVFTLLFLFLTGSITVNAAAFGISKNKVTINIGDSYDLDVTGTEKIPRWTTWGINKVNIDRDGVVTGIRAGKTTVSARIGLIVRKCTVTVVDPTITLNKKAATIYTGGNSAKMVQLKATSKGAAKGIVWNTSDSNVAIVDENGKVTSVAEGTAYITATANKETAVCEVTVKETRIRLDHDSITLSTKGTGSSILLRPVITGSKKEVKWTTSDKKVAIVKNGKVTGKGNGTVVVTATANGVSAACKVKVVTGSVSVNEEKALLYVGETKQLKTNAGKKDVVKWTSSDSAVATVDEKGKVTAVGAGSAKISANCFDTTDTCVVTVKETETKIGENTIELKTKGADRKFKLGYEVIGRKSAVKWTTSDKKVATVSNGTVTAKKAGTAVITATANGVSDTVFVTVKDYDPTIRLNRNEYVLYTGKGNIVTLKATVNGPLKKAIWKTSNEAVATVSTKGKVKGLSEGQAVITASANGVSAECLITVIQSETIPEKENVFLRKGEKTEIPADIIGEKQNITYKTTNKKVATVSKGIITAKKNGQADIKIIANGVTAVCHVYVSECTHVFDEGTVTKEPTCREKGICTRTCTICGEICVESVARTGHRFDEVIIVEPGCMVSGIKTNVCTVCEYTEQVMIAPVGHAYGEWTIITEATEFSNGIEKQYCVVCNAENIQIIPCKLHEHRYEKAETPATCTQGGFITYACVCGDSYINDYTDALGHEWSDWIVTKPASETEEGEQERTCGCCGEEEREVIPLLEHEHSYTCEVTEATCTEGGFTTYTCVCGDSYKDDEVEALGHNYSEWTVTEEATCIKEGGKQRICSYCEAEEKETISALGHDFDDDYTIDKEANCEEEGSKSQHCSRCDEKQNITSIPGGGMHIPVDGYCTECKKMIAGLYDADGALVATWKEAGINLETVYNAIPGDEFCYQTAKTSGYYVLTNEYPTTKKVFIPEESKYIGSYAFYNCTGLTSVIIPEGVTCVYDSAFFACSNLQEIIIPDGVTSIRESAFRSCVSMRTVELPESLQDISGYAFSFCSGLQSITIPSGVTSIGEDAFYGCKSLAAVYLETTNCTFGKGCFCDLKEQHATFLEPANGYGSIIYVRNKDIKSELLAGRMTETISSEEHTGRTRTRTRFITEKVEDTTHPIKPVTCYYTKISSDYAW